MSLLQTAPTREDAETVFELREKVAELETKLKTSAQMYQLKLDAADATARAFELSARELSELAQQVSDITSMWTEQCVRTKEATERVAQLTEALEWAERGIAAYETMLKYGAATPMLKFVREALRSRQDYKVPDPQRGQAGVQVATCKLEGPTGSKGSSPVTSTQAGTPHAVAGEVALSTAQDKPAVDAAIKNILETTEVCPDCVAPPTTQDGCPHCAKEAANPNSLVNRLTPKVPTQDKPAARFAAKCDELLHRVNEVSTQDKYVEGCEDCGATRPIGCVCWTREESSNEGEPK
jgi:hypothetical protein